MSLLTSNTANVSLKELTLLGRIPTALIEDFKVSSWNRPDRAFTEHDWNLALELMDKVGPRSDRTFNVHTHSQMTAVIARELTQRFNTILAQYDTPPIDTWRVMSLALIHDLGRFSTHALYVNDLLCHEVLQVLDIDLSHRQVIGFPHDYFHPERYLAYLQDWRPGAVSNPELTREGVTIESLIVIAADMMSKVDLSNNTLISLDDAISYHRKSRGSFETNSALRSTADVDTKHANLTERVRNRFRDLHITAVWAKVYKELEQWLLSLNIDPAEVQDAAWTARHARL